MSVSETLEAFICALEVRLALNVISRLYPTVGRADRAVHSAGDRVLTLMARDAFDGMNCDGRCGGVMPLSCSHLRT